MSDFDLFSSKYPQPTDSSRLSDLSDLSDLPNLPSTIKLQAKHKCKCQPKCETKQCPCPRKCLTVEEIACLAQNTVVTVHSEFILLGASGPNADIRSADISLQGLAPNTRADIILEGNGFFIEQHYIVTPAHLVLLPPSLTSVANRYPFFHSQPFNDDTRMSNLMVRASRILVTVFNVNNKKHSFVYEADLVGVDGAGDIALLRINRCKQWNFCNPFIEPCHPYLKFGHSCKTYNGEKVYVADGSVSAICTGLMTDNHHVDCSGGMLAETIVVSTTIPSARTGLPILDCRGRVIGMHTVNRSSKDSVSGPSEYFMRRVVKAFIEGSNDHLELITDTVGNYYRYRKAYLGLAYEVFTGINYDVTINYNTSSNVGDITGVPRIRLDANGEFMNSPSCKEIMGIRVAGLAGLNSFNDLYYVPGGASTAPLLNNLPISPLLHQLQPGDILTHINDIPIGNLAKQVGPAVLLWRCVGGQELTITYRRGGNFAGSDSNDFSDNYDNLLTCKICASEYPLGLDYPWYALDVFPLLATLPYPGFVFNEQLTQPQYPQLANCLRRFRASI